MDDAHIQGDVRHMIIIIIMNEEMAKRSRHTDARTGRIGERTNWNLSGSSMNNTALVSCVMLHVCVRLSHGSRLMLRNGSLFSSVTYDLYVRDQNPPFRGLLTTHTVAGPVLSVRNGPTKWHWSYPSHIFILYFSFLGFSLTEEFVSSFNPMAE